jgi:hypothetical protein
MIDFRYHLVSLVSVFLALAIGIALGAGPLREPIANTLQEQVDSLRTDRDTLRRDLGTAQASARNRDAFLSAVQPELIAEQLGGRSVVVVTLPGADGEAVGPLTTALQTAGARVTGRADLRDEWVDPLRQEAREQVVSRLRSLVPPPGSGNAQGETAAGLAALLSRALVTGELAQSEQNDPTGRRILDELGDAGMLTLNGDFRGRATEAVLLVPGVEAPVPDARPTPTPTPTPDTGPTWAALAAALDAGSDGAVVLGPASAAGAGGVLAAVRGAADVARLVSTVDTGGTPMGDVTTVLALREQQLGGAGSYGFAGGARAPLPVRTRAATPGP